MMVEERGGGSKTRSQAELGRGCTRSVQDVSPSRSIHLEIKKKMSMETKLDYSILHSLKVL